jgi:hypothetical protein
VAKHGPTRRDLSGSVGDTVEHSSNSLVAEREYTGGDNGPVPILELEDPDTGEPCAWIASSWHALKQLAAADPEVGDTIKVRRLADKGRSHGTQKRGQPPRAGRQRLRVERRAAHDRWAVSHGPIVRSLYCTLGHEVPVQAPPESTAPASIPAMPIV